MIEKHISVLLKESISSLNLKENSIIVDATLGYGGHSSDILDRIKKGYLFAFDQDSEAIRHSTDRLSKIGTNFTIIHSNFVHMKEELDKQGRVNISQPLIDYANLVKDCVVIGTGDRLEIWSQESWNGFFDSTKDNMSDIADHLFNESVDL